MTFLLVVSVAWAVLTAVLLLRLLRDYSRGDVSGPTAVLLWPWHLLNYVVLVGLAAEEVWRLDLPGGAAVGAALTWSGSS